MSGPAVPIAMLERFLAEDATPPVRSLLRNALDEARANEAIQFREFSFNVFDVKLDFGRRVATISDVLDPTAETVLPLAAFAEAL